MNVGSHYARIWSWLFVNCRTTDHKQPDDSNEYQIVSGRLRQAKVFAALVVSMAVGIVFLNALGSNPPSAGAFCLAQYRQLVPIEEAISSRVVQSAGRWNCIQVYYSGTKSGNSQPLALLAGQAAPKDMDCHFVIYNSLGGEGQIQRTEKWEKQQPVNFESPGQELQITRDGQTICICIIADGKSTRPTDMQIKRTEALVEGLCRRFDIQLGSIYYPGDWR